MKSFKTKQNTLMAILLALTIIISAVPLEIAYATENTSTVNNITCTVSDDGTVATFSGTGEIPCGLYRGNLAGVERFSNWSDSITSVIIKEGVTGIGYKAFYRCENLTEIEMPDSLTEIKPYSFYGCTNLTSIEIPDNVTSIGEYAFYQGFALANITLPDNLISIEAYAFGGCSITEIEIPDGVTEIGEGAFSYLAITEITIPDGITTIPDYAFTHCEYLIDITIPDSVNYIGEYAFWGTAWLTEQRENDPVVVVNNIVVDGYTATGNVAIPEGVTMIADRAFYRSDITGIEIPEGVTSIGAESFYLCSNVTSVNFPSTIESIGENAFYGCRGLTSISIPDSVTSIGDCAFEYCNNLSEITIPGSVNYIGGQAFWGTAWLTEQRENDPVVVINNIVVDGYTASGDVVIPEGVTAITAYAFGTQSNVSSKVTSVIMPDTVTSIGASAFGRCKNLTNITLSSNLTTIERCAFFECTSLTNIIIPEKVSYIGESAFSGCENLESIIIPDSVNYIGGSAFDETAWLTEQKESNPLVIVNNILVDGTASGDVVIPSGVTSIVGYDASNLTSLTIPDSVTYIEECVFSTLSYTDFTSLDVYTNNDVAMTYDWEPSGWLVTAFAYNINLSEIEMEVYGFIESEYAIKAPKTVVLNTKAATTSFYIEVKGNIAPTESLLLTINETVDIHRTKDENYNNTATCKLTTTAYTEKELCDTYTKDWGTITFKETKAGEYTGTITLYVELVTTDTP